MDFPEADISVSIPRDALAGSALHFYSSAHSPGNKREGVFRRFACKQAIDPLRNGDNLRSVAGVFGAVASVLLLGSTLISLALLEASFRTWTVGRYFSGRAIVFSDAFMITAVLSVITLILSCFTNGKLKITGLCASSATILLVVLIFWTGA
jgi:hypothetical protein